jgi:heme a synthase
MNWISVRHRTDAYKSNLSGFCFLTFAVTLVLLYAGGFTTTIGAGMVFPDWPLSNGSLNPPGWTTDEAMLAEHSHRLLGALVGNLAIILCIWMYFREERAWLRKLSYAALALVIFQGLLGGMRVLMVNVDLAKVHGVTAQVFLCLLAAIAAGSSRWWREVPVSVGSEQAQAWNRQRMLGFLLCGLIIAQLVVGAVMRHRGAGMAIPYFPHSAPDGSFLPVSWNWATMVHFSHRVLAVVISVMLVLWVWKILQSAVSTRAMKVFGIISLCLLVLQIYLGASIIWSTRQPFPTTLHVLNGALLLSFTWIATFAYCRPLFDGEGRTVAAANSNHGYISVQSSQA